MTTDEKIDIVLSKFCKTGKFDFKENLTFYNGYFGDIDPLFR